MQKNYVILPLDAEAVPAGEASGETVPVSRHIARLEEICQSLVAYFETKHPYLDPNLSPKDVERYLGVNTKYLSQAIKQVSGGGFYAFVNSCRVDHAIALIRQHKGMMLSKLLCSESGFRSSSTFYAHFRQRTGVTPQEYRGEG